MVLHRGRAATRPGRGRRGVRFPRRDGARLGASTWTRCDGAEPAGRPGHRPLRRLADEQAHPFPDRAANAYPFAYEQVAQLLRLAGGARPDRDPHLGPQLGGRGRPPGRARLDRRGAGPGAVHPGGGAGCAGRARAAALPAGRRGADGARALGVGPATGSGSTGRRGPTRCCPPGRRGAGRAARRPVRRPRHVVGFLFDGCQRQRALRRGRRRRAPNVARLMARGTRWGTGPCRRCPRVTLANHTGDPHRRAPGPPRHLEQRLVGPGRGRAGHHQLAGDVGWSMASLDPASRPCTRRCSAPGPGRSPLHQRAVRQRGRRIDLRHLSATAAPSTGRRRVEDLPFATERFVRPAKEYRWRRASTTLRWRRPSTRGRGRPADPLPRFTWVNFSLTDAAFHEGGRYSDIAAASLHDTDARLGEVLDAVERAGVLDAPPSSSWPTTAWRRTTPRSPATGRPVLADTGVPLPRRGLRLHLRRRRRRPLELTRPA